MAKATREQSLRYTTEEDDACETSGWLVKEGKTLKQPKPRFLRLCNSQLSNHRDPSSPATWTVSIVDCSVGPGPRKNEVLVNLPKRRVSFFAESSAQFERWIFALKKGSSSTASIETFYSLGGVIGEGVNGEVLQGWDKATNESVAVKSIPYEGDMMQKSDPEAEEEIRIVKSLCHPHLVRTYDIFRDLRQKRIYIVMEYVGGGELFARVANATGSLIKEGDAIRVSRNILRAVLYLHDRNIVHRDIKLENILCLDPDIQKPVQVKLADFGLSSRLSGKNPSLKSLVGTSFYIAPEIIQEHDYGSSVDMWACGVVFYIMLSGQFPFCGRSDEEYYKNVVEQTLEFPDAYWANISNGAKDLIQGLLTKDPKSRLTAKEALQHKWVADSQIAEFEAEQADDSEDDLAFAAPKSIFGGKKRTPAQILAKVKSSHYTSMR